jgi:hypothetical protein
MRLHALLALKMIIAKPPCRELPQPVWLAMMPHGKQKRSSQFTPASTRTITPWYCPDLLTPIATPMESPSAAQHPPPPHAHRQLTRVDTIDTVVAAMEN